MNQKRQHHSAVNKVEILREHLENQEPISELARRFTAQQRFKFAFGIRLF